jgi:hypothetical protein
MHIGGVLSKAAGTKSTGIYEPPPLVPGLPIVWTPTLVGNALRQLLDVLGVGRAPLVGYLELLGIWPKRRSHHGAGCFTACPGCRRPVWRLFWDGEAFRGLCCARDRQHGPRCTGGRHLCRRRIVCRPAVRAGDYLFACRIGAPAAARVRQDARRRLSAFASRCATVKDATVIAAAATALAAPPPPPLRPLRAPGPLTRALAGELLDVLVLEVWSLAAYQARIVAELAGRDVSVGA